MVEIVESKRLTIFILPSEHDSLEGFVKSKRLKGGGGQPLSIQACVSEVVIPSFINSLKDGLLEVPK